MYDAYKKYALEQSKINPENWNFKRNNYYTEILEHVNQQQGSKYLHFIKTKFKKFYKTHSGSLKEICLMNDKYGKTRKSTFNSFMECSPTNLRYILHSLLSLEYMKNLGLSEVNIIEIGGGYGGLCLFMCKIAPLYNITINSYTIFDLPEVILLQEKYLNTLDIKNINYCTLNNYENLNNNSFLISNYAFSEIPMNLQKEYTKKILNPYVQFGFMAWNFIPVYQFIDGCHIQRETEYPKTGKNNLYVRFYLKTYYGQVEQDKFVLKILKQLKNGFFLEIGSNHPINSNNTYVLEKKYNWKGIMIEYDDKWLESYKIKRPNSIHIIDDATKIDYAKLFQKNNVPINIDYLQIDLEANNGSTLDTLKKLNNEVMDKYKFATITFEHDIYHTNYLNTRNISREIFKNRGYIRVFSDINNGGRHPFEDWYVHPDLVDMDFINKIIENNIKNYKTNVKQDVYFKDSIVEKSINWQDIEYI